MGRRDDQNALGIHQSGNAKGHLGFAGAGLSNEKVPFDMRKL